MQKTIQRSIFIGTITFLLLAFNFLPIHAQGNEDQPVVRAVLFYSPTCGHCENVIQNLLPPLLKQYGDQLKIVAINVSLPDGQALYQSTIEHFDIAENRMGVPTLIVDDIVMVGGAEIPTEFPVIVADRILGGGTNWPDIPGLADTINVVNFSSQPTGNASTGNENSFRQSQRSQSMFDKFMQDPIANSIAVIVLVFMIGSVIWVIIRFTRPLPKKDFWPTWIIPVLSILGIGVAFYLTYVETSGAEAVCGPVGDCNTVQLSPYALLFGVLPVGLLGLIGYAMILGGWVLNRYGPSNIRWISAIAIWGMAFFGVLYSIYLTFLEPFVIGATCMWCISSAIFQTIIFLAATGPAKRAWQVDDFDDEYIDENSYDAESLFETENVGIDTQIDSTVTAINSVENNEASVSD
jgi:uncharacterized membrane protein